ncbi:response regulator transcription factor [Mycetohabitans endofungorum]|uniref:response regulator transcription factor n=1 Tax=Mycetohabitans endofungorum TaxID=417203 RepID=UPI002B053846|nr:response regulator transcription factor [Mycetohabitans endofungorum]
MGIAILTGNRVLFQFIEACFKADDEPCQQFVDDVALARAVYREEFQAILVDSAIGINPLRPFLARRACYADRRAPLVVIGALEDQASIVHVLDAGADDVVLTPIDPRELLLRVHLAIRRFNVTRRTDHAGVIECGPYRLDPNTCIVRVNGDAVRLTPREFAIAWLLFSHYGEYVSRRQIAGAVWSSSEDIVGRTLEQHIYKLRKKLELHGTHGLRLRTMYAHGYRVEAIEADTATSAMMNNPLEAPLATAHRSLGDEEVLRRHDDVNPTVECVLDARREWQCPASVAPILELNDAR